MPETPDFDQIAANIVGDDSWRDREQDKVARIAEQLRQVWNARGAADLAGIAPELPPQYQVVTATAITALDR